MRNQDREGIAPELTEEKRFFALKGTGKDSTPKGWNDPKNQTTLDEIPEDKVAGFAACGNGSTFAVIDYDHVLTDDGQIYKPAMDVLNRIAAIGQTYTEVSVSGHGLHQIIDLGSYADTFDPISNGTVIRWGHPEAKIELFFNTAGRYIYLTGHHSSIAKNYRVASEETAAAIWSEYLRILRETGGQVDKKEKGKHLIDTNGVIPEGERHYYIVAKIGELVGKLGTSVTAEAILAMVEEDFRTRCANPGNVNMKDFRKKYLKTIQQFQSRREEEAADPDFWPYAMRAWKAENPEVEFEGDWEAVRSAGERARDQGLELPATQTRKHINKRHSDPDDQIQRLGLDLTERLTVRSSFGNYCKITEGDEYLDGKIYYNALDGRVMLRGVEWDCDDHPIRDVDLGHIRQHVSNTYGIDDENKLKRAIDIAADRHKVHPIRELLDGLKWDGVPRLADLFPRYLGAERSEYTAAVTQLLFNGAIQRVRHPGIKFDCCIVLADTKQGTGKSSLCRFLALRDEWFCDALGDLADTKKAYEAIRGHWICELGEMIATRRTRDIESIKAYISRTADDYRDPYGVYPERRPRQCVFIGTSNRPQFLPDDKTGNRRFIPILCDGDQSDRHPLDDEQETREYIMQCYAEAIAIGERDGFTLVLGDRFTDELNTIRELSTPEDSMIGLIQSWLDVTTLDLVCTRSIWDEVFRADRGDPQPYDLQNISDIMNLKVTGWERYRGKTGKGTSYRARFPKYGSQRAWARVQSVSSGVSKGVSSEFMELSDDDQKELPFGI